VKAVILAAGSGSRFVKQGITIPKTLIKLGGLPLLERVVKTAAKAGIKDFIIVAGDHLETIKEHLTSHFDSLNIEWVHNPKWQSGNGSSLLAAKPFLNKQEHFLVLMSDHLFLAKTLSKLIQTSEKENQSLMAIDQKKQAVSDISDATKVKLNEKHIRDVGKTLESYEGIDIGAGVCTLDIMDELSSQISENGGTCTHGEGMKRLAQKGKLLYFDIGKDTWEDVDDTSAYKAAEKVLYQSLRKETDGFLSRVLERRISLTVTRFLANTSLKPNVITFFNTGLGILSGFLFASPNHKFQMAGAIAFWFSSCLDGCDGELARLKFMESRFGGWLDLLSDNLIHVIVFSGIGAGLYRNNGDPLWLILGGTASLGVVLSTGWVSLKTLKGKKESGTLYTSVVDQTKINPMDKGTKLMVRLADQMSRRDFIFWLMFITFLGWHGYFLWLAAIGSILYFLVLVMIQWRMDKNHA